ncbi:hypothetical protein IEO21_02511 [Rhodonia placenta]|uniref:Glycogen [starch] synthase n=1 Tax=Rhodonia placenta TaxID=104341 RepID=A0A8H7P7I0_9APHY|nr:hypothetical protein IEO21_02511 [Postia placenta]
MTNLSGFGCFMQDLIQRPQDEGCYIVDWHSQSVEDSPEDTAAAHQPDEPRRAAEPAAGLEEPRHRVFEGAAACARVRARLWHGAHDAKLGPHEPALPHVRLRDPGDIGTLTEEMRMSGTSDYRGYQWPRHMEDEDEGHPM